MGFLDWITKKALGEEAPDLERKPEPLDGRLRDSINSYIEHNYGKRYVTQDEKDRAAEKLRRAETERKKKEAEERVARLAAERAAKEAEEKKEQEEPKPVVKDSGIKYSLPSADDREGLSREAESYFSSKDRYIEQLSFTDSLRMYAIKSGMDNTEIYKRANLSKSVFSSIFTNGHIPKKGTVVALAIALRLDLRETERLLMKAGYTFSNSIKADLIAVYFINHKLYDIDKLNSALYDAGEPILGSKSY